MSGNGSHVAMLKGGWSSEREVSLVSGAECARALRQAGYKVSEIDVGRDIARVLHELLPDLAFNALHGPWGEDGCIQGLLEVMGLPYTHSGVLASALAMDKPKSKQVFAEAGLTVAKDLRFDRGTLGAEHPLAPPYVIKPSANGSSVGVFIVSEGQNRPPEQLYSDDWKLGDDLMAEEYIPGRELTATVLGDRALAVTEIFPAKGYYDYEAKYAAGGSSHTVPADIPKAAYDQALEMALVAHEAIGCRGVTRTDFRYDHSRAKGQELVVLEINTQPGMTPTSLVPEQAAFVGMGFTELCQWIAEDASCNR